MIWAVTSLASQVAMSKPWRLRLSFIERFLAPLRTPQKDRPANQKRQVVLISSGFWREDHTKDWRGGVFTAHPYATCSLHHGRVPNMIKHQTSSAFFQSSISKWSKTAANLWQEAFHWHGLANNSPNWVMHHMRFLNVRILRVSKLSVYIHWIKGSMQLLRQTPLISAPPSLLLCAYLTSVFFGGG